MPREIQKWSATEDEEKRFMPKYSDLKKPEAIRRKRAGHGSGQRVVSRTLEGVEVSVPYLPYEWMIDSQGNVVAATVSTNWNSKEGDLSYYALKKRIRKHEGWLPYYEVQVNPKTGKPYEASEWPAVRAEIINSRRTRAAAISAQFDNAGRGQVEQIAQGITGAFDQLTSVLKEQNKRGKAAGT